MESFDKVEESPKEKKKKTKETRKATSAPLRKSREMEVPCLFVCLIVSFFFLDRSNRFGLKRQTMAGLFLVIGIHVRPENGQ